MQTTTRRETVETTDTAEDKPYLVLFQVLNLFLFIIEGFLLLRFILRMMGANAAAGFTQFVYGISGVFMAPFTFIFPQSAADEFVIEWSVLLAMVVYALLIYLLKRMVMVFYTADADT